MSDLVLAGVTLRRRDRVVLDDIRATFASGRLTVVIGPNGAGKSTLLAVAAGLQPVDAGTATLGGVPLARIGREALARQRAYLPQAPEVGWPMAVERVVALGLGPLLPTFGAVPAPLARLVERAMADHDLLHLRGRPATQLSGGELARVMLARATVADPPLLIVDEPTAGLDPRHALGTALRLRARADAGRAVAVALHDLSLALLIADDAVALRNGRVVAAGPAETVLTEATLGQLYDMAVRIDRNRDGPSVRFLSPHQGRFD